jgi:cytochrome c oxidase assembly protein subunit 15
MDGVQDVRPSSSGETLAIAFGTTVAMWAVGYVCRIPPAIVPSWMVLALMLICLASGGFVAGRYGHRGWRGGMLVGLLAAALNLLVLGSALASEQPNQIVPSAVWWLPGWFIVAGLVGALGGALGASSLREETTRPNWSGVLAIVGALATLMLLIMGGLVTGRQAGLAVPDWPNTFGYNMFLYPLSRMTGGVYYEHAHRLYGTLVGLTTIALAIHLWRTDRRRWLKVLAGAAILMVIIQGVLGGFRVEEARLADGVEISAPEHETAWSLRLAVAHGVFGQVFFSVMVAMTVFTSRAWQANQRPRIRRSTATEHTLAVVLVALLIVQLVFGAVQRHVAEGLLIHISLAVVVMAAAVTCGTLAWGRNADQPILIRCGRAMLALIGLQLLLGFGALIVLGVYERAVPPATTEVLVTTAHQAVGAVLLACAVMTMLWNFRLISPRSGADSAAEHTAIRISASVK